MLAGKTIARTSHFALHCTAFDLPDSQGNSTPLFVPHDVWLGAMVPKRWAKRAVTRNTIKRQIYALGDEYVAELQCAAHLVRLRSSFDKNQFISATSEVLRSAVRNELQQLFAQALASYAVRAAR